MGGALVLSRRGQLPRPRSDDDRARRRGRPLHSLSLGQRFAPEMEKRLRWQWRRPQSASCRVDETYVKVRGKWAYLYRALDKLGNTIDFYLSATRNTKAAKRFLGKALRGLEAWEQREVLNTDKAPTYAAAIAQLKAEGRCPPHTRHRQVKYLNNVVGADHGKLKQLDRAGTRIQDVEDGLRHDQGLRGDAGVAQGSGWGVRPRRRHRRRSQARRARLRRRAVRADRGYGVAPEPSGHGTIVT